MGARRQVIVIPWFVRLYEEIIHELNLVDYLLVQADKPSMIQQSYTNLISVDLAQNEIFRATICDFGQGGILLGKQV